MKKLRFFLTITLAVCCLLALSACSQLEKLSPPEKVEVENTTLTLTWREVKNARLYTISIQAEGQEPQEFVASKNSYSLSQLSEGRYTIKVKANGKAEENRDSDWSQEIPFYREPEPGMVFTLNSEKTEYTVASKGIATGHIVIPDRYRGLPVTSIGDKAFFNKNDVTGITFGANIRSIGNMAFANCSYLTAVTLPEGLTHLGENAFASCRLLDGSVTIPEGITEIPTQAFAYCASLDEIHLGSRVTSIGASAFTDCTELTTLVLPDSLKTLGERAFLACTNLSSLTLGASLESIGGYAFSKVTSLTSVRIPDSVKFIGEGAFYQCAALDTVQLGTGVTEIDLGAFLSTGLWEKAEGNEVYVGQWFLGLKDITATTINLRPDTIGIANYALIDNAALTTVQLPNSVMMVGKYAFARSKVTTVVLGSGVKTLGAQAFVHCTNLSTLILGSFDFTEGKLESSSLHTIGEYAFLGCTVLERLEMPDSVRVIESQAFMKSGLWNAGEDGVIYVGRWVVGFAESLAGEITLKDGTYGIANYAFYNCDAMTSVKLPSTVATIGRAAFYDCSALTSVELPDTLERIEDYTFFHCDYLQLRKLPVSLKSIGRSAFYMCASRFPAGEESTEADRMEGTEDTLVIPESVESIGAFAFYGCGQAVTSLDSAGEILRGIDVVIIGNGVKSIGEKAFQNFASLTKVVIGNGVETIGPRAFYKCAALREVVFGDHVKIVGEKAFYRCTALSSVKLPDSVEQIDGYAFYKCEGLKAVDLGHGVRSIDIFAFYGCVSIERVTLPSSLEHIGRQAFRNCWALSSVILSDSVRTIEKHAFYGCKSLTLYVERTSAAETWDKYWNSSYRPVVWGCVLSEEGDYVLGFAKTEGSISNKNASNVISAPSRAGYVFVGWNTNSSATTAAYTSENLTDAPVGRTLYAIWAEDVEH